jgi:hypothetical protein
VGKEAAFAAEEGLVHLCLVLHRGLLGLRVVLKCNYNGAGVGHEEGRFKFSVVVFKVVELD